MSDQENLIDAIDSLLPQTQCQLCDYADCHTYALAIVTQKEKLNRCLPGGVRTLRELGELLNQDIEPYLVEMTKRQKLPQVAIIREEECIGCTKCIQACPVDAIIGSSKHMHTILSDVCTGCELCIEPCPVDCIELTPIYSTDKPTKAAKSLLRYQHRQARLLKQQQLQKTEQQICKQSISERQVEIRAAIARVKNRGKRS